jgi:hypothetical protein
VELSRNAEPFQNGPGPGLGGVSVVVLDDLLHLGETVSVEILLGPSQNLFPLLQGLP